MKAKLFFIILFINSLAYAGVITLSTSSLPSFGNVYVYHSSTSFRYTITATALTSNLVITAPVGFEISTQYAQGYTTQLSITPVSGSIPTTAIYVSFSPAAVGAANGNITHSSTGSSTQNISVLGTGTNWSIPTNYYNTVNTQRNAALKTVLYNKILGHTSVSYTPGVWNAYATTDRQPNSKVWDIYSTRFDAPSPYEYTMVTNQCGNYSTEGDCYNREHSFPQSWFNSSSPMVTDIHHVMASDGKVNGMRNNYPFGNVSSATFTSLYGGKLGTGSNFGYTGVVFEPNNEYKGDIARAQLYMATRYENLIAGWLNNGNANDVLAGNSYPAYDLWYINLLLSWHNIDPVSDKEIKRNDAIYAIQNNRNPFVDSPQFVQRIWGGSLPAEPTVAASNLQVINLSNTSVKLNWVSGNGNRRVVLVKAASAVNVLPVDTVNYLANASFTNATNIGGGNYVVYNGTSSTVTITNLQAGVNYYYAVVEYNGWYTAANYNTTNVATFNATTLPVNWLSFTGKLVDKNVYLNWSTASEKNNKGFVIERSFDGKLFTEIANVSGNGNSNSINQYQFIDEDVTQNSTIYYRLKQIDFNGVFNYSNVVLVTSNEQIIAPVFGIAPNPFVNNIRILYQTNQPAAVSYTLTNSSGLPIKQGYEHTTQTQGEFNLDIDNNLQPGIYFMQIEHNNRQYNYKIIKQ